MANTHIPKQGFVRDPYISTRHDSLNLPANDLMADSWICCQGGHINLFALAPERCSICSHPRCTACTTGRPGMADGLPSSSRARSSRHSLTHSHARSGQGSESSRHRHTRQPSSISSASSGSGTSRRGAEGGGRGGGGSHHNGGYEYLPPMTGYWVCCMCQNANNHALWGDTCPIDGHTRCVYNCYVYTR